MSARIEAVNETNFATAVLESTDPVLVDFWAQWCGPCRTLAPIVEELAEEYAGAARVVKLNVDDSPALAERYRVRAIPTLILFRDGEEKERIIGLSNRDAIARKLDEQMNAAAQ